MSELSLSCAETPLAWPLSTQVGALTPSSTSGVHVFSPHSGSLQILTRRQQGGFGDGVNIVESNTVAADFRGQRYSYDEAIFHTPGLHVFPGQTEVYPAEYHVYLETFAEPKRAITLVIPVSHHVTAPGVEYWAACSAKPDPTAVRPVLTSLLTTGTPVVAYRGPDLRGRTADHPTTEACSTPEERQFLLVMSPVQIRASDLERIPREGSLSTDPRDLPAKGISPTTAVTQDRLIRTAVLCMPGVVTTPSDIMDAKEKVKEKAAECKPIKVIDGVPTISGGKIDFSALDKPKAAADTSNTPTLSFSTIMKSSITFICVMTGLVVADYFVSKLWHLTMKSTTAASLDRWEPLKLLLFVGIALGGAKYIR